MATAKKLPSGSWRCRVYSHTDAKGRKVYESFTAATKREAEAQAAKFANDADRARAEDITVQEAVDKYIAANENVLSPTTLRGYTMDAKRITSIANIRIRKLKSLDLQKFVSDLSTKYAPKTVKNTYALVITSVAFSGVETRFRVNLPTIPKKRKTAPEDDKIKALYNAANPIMKKVIILAVHSLRLGEICGLKYSDLNGNKLYIHSDLVQGKDGLVHKDIPKTESSNRTVILTKNELEILGNGAPDAYIVPRAPSTLDHNFHELTKKLEIEGVTIHTLRSYFASVAVAIGVPDLYTSHMGGWRENSTVLKEHYQKKIVSMDEAYADKLNNYFSEVLKEAKN